VVAHIRPAADEGDEPSRLRRIPVQDEYDGGPPGARPELPPAVDRTEQAFESI
jgi:hypothetical protein